MAIERAAAVTVGDEILLGEIVNDNQRLILQLLQSHGIGAGLALSLPDDSDLIGHWIGALTRDGYRPIVVSGGIGGTHDDQTRAGIARGLGVPLVRHERCFEILAARYQERFNAQRQRMAQLPAGCELIANPLGAPGFFLQEVYAFPGFPTMLEPMLRAVLAEHYGSGQVRVGEAFELPCAEGDIAAEIEAFAVAHPHAKIGIYPSTAELGRRVRLRIRCAPEQQPILAAFRELVARLRAKHGT